MSDEKMTSFRTLFESRLATLSHILDVSAQHFHRDPESIFHFRLAEDMLPFGTQIAYTCNQPYNFALWCEGKEADNFSAEMTSIDQANQMIKEVTSRLATLDLQDSKLADLKRIEIGGDRYIELSGLEFVNDFLIANLYFHMVTAYDIMRMKGVPLGKENYMLHLLPLVKQG